MYKIKRYFKGVLKQGKMVRWPSPKELLGYFTVVVSVVLFSAIACSIDDRIIIFILDVLEKNLGSGTASSSEAASSAFHALTNLWK